MTERGTAWRRITPNIVAISYIPSEIRHACRRLVSTPFFTVFVVISLALGLGVTTAAYSLVQSLLWNGNAIPNAEHLVVVTRATTFTGGWRQALSRPDFDDLRTRFQSVPDLAASSLVLSALNDGVHTSPFWAQAVTGNFFSVVKLPLFEGRGIEPADDRPGADAVVVLSYDFWKARVGGDVGIIGRAVRVNEKPLVVVGIAAQRVHSRQDTYGRVGLVGGDGWISLRDKELIVPVVTTSRDDRALTILGRLPAGVSVDAAKTEVAMIGHALDLVAPLGNPPLSRSWSIVTAAAVAREGASGGAGAVGAALVMLVSLVLALACTNVGNLTLGRGSARVTEYAVRLSLGSSRVRLVREQLMESVLLAILGGAAGAVVAVFLVQRLSIQMSGGNFNVIKVQPELDGAAIFVAGLSLLLSLVVFGLVPAVWLARSGTAQMLNKGSQVAGSAVAPWAGRRILIAAQVAISTAFVLIALTTARSVVADAGHDPGFDLSHLAVGFVSLHGLPDDSLLAREPSTLDGFPKNSKDRTPRAAETPESAQADRAKQPPVGLRAFSNKAGGMAQLTDGPDGRSADPVQQAIVAIQSATASEIGFDAVAITRGLPLGVGLRVRQIASLSTLESPVVTASAVTIESTPEIFRTLGVPVTRGRGLATHDTASMQHVIVLSEGVARQLFKDANVVGRQVGYEGPGDSHSDWAEVVGVARDTDAIGLSQRTYGLVYVPLAQHPARSVIVVGRTSGDPSGMTGAFARAVRKVNPDFVVEFASTGDFAMAGQVEALRVVAVISGALAGLVLLLSMCGLYGVLAHIVSRRTREIGLRMALGADPTRVVTLVVFEGLRPVAWGLGLGLLFGVGASLVIRATVVGAEVAPVDAMTSVLASGLLLFAGFIASYIPARRARRVDPNVALRAL